MKSPKDFFLLIFLSGVFSIPNVLSQNKFEFGVSFDPVVVPIDFGTYVENGPGFYDIIGRGKITQAGAAYFIYWPFRNIGFSIGEGIRSFRSQIDYAIPDPLDENLQPIFEGSYPFSAKGWGPSVGILWRMEKWKARIGYGVFDLYDLKYTSNNSISVVSIGGAGGTIANIELEELAYWNFIPYSYGFMQFEAQYNVFDNLYVKVGFESTGRSRFPPPYTLRITGFSPQSGPQSRVLNDYKMLHTLTSFSFGVGYTIGFGNYKYNKQDSE